MSAAQCPKCSAGADLIGSKLVCSECYFVFDGASASVGPKSSFQPTATPAPTMTRVPEVGLKLSKDPNAPLPTIPKDPVAVVLPGRCPKCNGETTDIGGRLVCDTCYHVVDLQAKPPARVSVVTSGEAAPSSTGAIGVVIIIVLVIVIVVGIAFKH